ncbi:substrate-binding domain-containing protein, partial [Streptomyces sp. NPDC003401]
MRTRRAALGIITGASLALALSACGEQSAAGSGSEGGTIGIAMPTKSSERWLTDGRSVVKDLEAKGYKTKLVYGDDDPQAQVTQISDLVEERVDALIIAAIDNKSLTDVLKQAAAADIPVISYDRLILDSGNVDYYVSFDNEQVGRQQARYIIDRLGLEDDKGPFTIELFAGSPDDNNTRYFYEGAMYLLQPYLDSGQLVVRSGETKLEKITTLRWDGTTAESRMKRILSKSYNGRTVDAVLSPYDGISLGVLAALKSYGYGSDGKDLPIVTGQ